MMGIDSKNHDNDEVIPDLENKSRYLTEPLNLVSLEGIYA